MATSGSFYTNIYETSESPTRYLFSWSLASQSIVNNTSTISWSLVGAGGATDGRWVYVKEKYCTVNGTTKSNSTLQQTYNGTVAFSGTTVITHNSDGTKSFSASAGGAFYYYGEYNSTGSGTWALPTIARATTPTLSVSSQTMGSSITITMKPADSTFKHKLRYIWSDATERTTGLSVGSGFTAAGNTTATFTIPTSLANYIPYNNSGTGSIVCYTYTSSGTHIGTKTVTFTATVPSYTPTISAVALTGNNLLSSAYVQNKSTATISITASSLYGASIKSYSSTIDGKTYTGQKFTTSVFSTSGSKSISVTVTDTRGKTATFTSSSTTTPATFTVYAYANPSITGFTLVRDETTPTTVVATVNGSISAINNKNSKVITVTLNGVTNTITSSSYAINGTTTFTNVSTDSSFVGVATFKDSYSSVSKNVVLPTVAVTMDFYKDGSGIAMGKVAEYGNLLDVNWPLRARGIATIDGLVTLKNHLYHHGHIYMGGNKTATGENHIKFSNPDSSTYPHNVYIYGGSPSSDTAVGLYDAGNARNVIVYKDGTNAISIGSGSATINFNGNKMADFVVEQGTQGDWTYRKWNNGFAECWRNVSVTPSTVNGTNSITMTLPFTFANTDYNVTITPAKASMYVDRWGDSGTNGAVTHTTTTFTMAYNYAYGTAYAVSFNVVVNGNWK